MSKKPLAVEVMDYTTQPVLPPLAQQATQVWRSAGRAAALCLVCMGTTAAVWAQLPAGNPEQDSIPQLTAQIDAAPTADLYLARGMVYLETGDPLRAVADLSAAMGLGARAESIWAARGEAYAALQDFPAAIADFNEAIRQQPDRVELYLERGFAYGQAGDFETALKDFDQAILLDSRNVRARTLRGAARDRLGDRSGAIADLSVAVEESAQDPNPLVARAMVHRSAGNYDLAREDLTRAVDLVPSPAVFRQRASLYREMGLRAQEVNDLTAAIELALPDSSQDSVLVAQDRYLRGVAMMETGSLEAAAADFKNALSLNPDDPNAKILLTQVEAALAEEDSTGPLLANGGATEAHEPVSQDLASAALRPTGNAPEEVSVANIGSSEVAPSGANLPESDGAATQDPQSSRAETAAASAVNPVPPTPPAAPRTPARATAVALKDPADTGSTTLTAEQYHARGRALLQEEDFPAAIEQLTRALELNGRHALALNARGFAHYRLKEYSAAIRDFDLALTVDPNYVNALQNRSQARRATGDSAGAAADARQVSELLEGRN